MARSRHGGLLASRWWSGGLGATIMLALVGALFAGCVGAGEDTDGSNSSGGGGSGDTTVDVTFGQPHEFGIELGADSAPAGEVTFEVTNAGALPHQFVIVRHDGEADSLPTVEVNVDTTQVEILGDSGNLDPDQSATVPVNLDAGSYVIYSSTGGHYQAGMFAPFTVE